MCLWCSQTYIYLSNRIDEAGIAGISLPDLHTKYNETHSFSPSSIQEIVKQLIGYCLVLSVGINTRVFVSHANSRMWVVHSLRDTKGQYTSLASPFRVGGCL